MLDKINGYKMYSAGALMILTGVLQMLCTIAGVCLLPDAMTVGNTSGWELILLGLTTIGAKSAITKIQPPPA